MLKLQEDVYNYKSSYVGNSFQERRLKSKNDESRL